MKFLLFVFIFLISGCEDKTLTKIYDPDIAGEKISTLKVFALNQKLKDSMTEVLKTKGISVNDKSEYILQVDERAYEYHCNNPSTPAYEATYDGYAQIKLMKNSKPIFMAQKDYHGKFNSSILSNLVDTMIKKLKIVQKD